VKSVFSRIVSPKIVNELLQGDSLPSLGTRRQVTVLFADVRGFTELSDNSQERVAEYVREQNLTGAAAQACIDETGAGTARHGQSLSWRSRGHHHQKRRHAR